MREGGNKIEWDNSPQPEDIAHRWAGLFATRLDESGTALLASLRTFQTLTPYVYCRLDAISNKTNYRGSLWCKLDAFSAFFNF